MSGVQVNKLYNKREKLGERSASGSQPLRSLDPL